MERGYLCAVLQFLLKSGTYGTPLVKMPVDKDNEASLELLCALFKHCECHENLPDAVSFSIHNTSQHLVYSRSASIQYTENFFKNGNSPRSYIPMCNYRNGNFR